MPQECFHPFRHPTRWSCYDSPSVQEAKEAVVQAHTILTKYETINVQRKRWNPTFLCRCSHGCLNANPWGRRLCGSWGNKLKPKSALWRFGWVERCCASEKKRLRSSRRRAHFCELHEYLVCGAIFIRLQGSVQSARVQSDKRSSRTSKHAITLSSKKR